MTGHLDAHEQALEAAYEKALSALKKKSTAENVKHAEASRKALEDYRAELAAKTDPEARRFKTLVPEALEYLQSEGWKVKKTKLSADRNKIVCESDGTFTKKAIDEYAGRALKKTDGSDKAAVDDARRKAKLELDILDEDFKKKKRANEIESGLWTRTSDIESMLAARAALLKNGIGPEFIHTYAPQLITLVNGDQAKAPDLIEFWLKEVEEFMNRYSAPVEFVVPMQAAGKEEE